MADFRARIRDDGTVDGHLVETYYHECERWYVDEENGFVGIIADGGGYDIETRVSVEALHRSLPAGPTGDARPKLKEGDLEAFFGCMAGMEVEEPDPRRALAERMLEQATAELASGYVSLQVQAHDVAKVLRFALGLPEPLAPEAPPAVGTEVIR